MSVGRVPEVCPCLADFVTRFRAAYPKPTIITSTVRLDRTAHSRGHAVDVTAAHWWHADGSFDYAHPLYTRQDDVDQLVAAFKHALVAAERTSPLRWRHFKFNLVIESDHVHIERSAYADAHRIQLYAPCVHTVPTSLCNGNTTATTLETIP